MLLSGEEIKKNLGTNIIIEPYSPSQLNPNSYNLRLSNELLVYDTDVLDMKANNPVKRLTIPETGLLLETNKLYLGRTLEYTKTDQFVPMLEGRSSRGPVGAVHPRHRRLWRRGVCRILDAGDVLHPPHRHLPQCGDLPDLLSHHPGGIYQVRQRQVPKQHRRAAQHALQRLPEEGAPLTSHTPAPPRRPLPAGRSLAHNTRRLPGRPSQGAGRAFHIGRFGIGYRGDLSF